MWLRRARPVLDITTGQTFATAKDAALAIGCSRALVCYVLAGAVRSACGHFLRWADDREVLDVTDRRVYPTAADAARALRLPLHELREALEGDDVRAGGHRLRWLDECPGAHVD